MWRPRASAVRGVARWAGLSVCVLLAGLWLVSGWNHWWWYWIGSRSTWRVDLVRGRLVFYGFFDPATQPRERGMGVETRRMGDFERPGWEWGFERGYEPSGKILWAYVPLWAVAAVVSTPTAWLWWRDGWRRRRPGACQRCGYPRAGLGAGAVCPECGEASSGVTGSSGLI